MGAYWRKSTIATAAALIMAAVLGGTLPRNGRMGDPGPEGVSAARPGIATTGGSLVGCSVQLAEDMGFFADQGIRPDFQYNTYGKQSIEALLSGKADFAVTSETPYIRAVMAGEPISALAVLITARDHLGIVARRDRGIGAAPDLAGKVVGVAPGSNCEYLLDLVLAINDLAPSVIRRAYDSPDNLVERLLRPPCPDKAVDAIALWNPKKSETLLALGQNGVHLDAGGIYAAYFVLTARKDYIDRSPEIVLRTLRAIVAASDAVRDDPSGVFPFISRRVTGALSVADLSPARYDVRPQLDQAFLYTLEDQARWTAETGEGRGKKIPNFLEYIYFEGLTAVSPQAVSLIH